MIVWTPFKIALHFILKTRGLVLLGRRLTYDFVGSNPTEPQGSWRNWQTQLSEDQSIKTPSKIVPIFFIS
jgi:hypothetical protein